MKASDMKEIKRVSAIAIANAPSASIVSMRVFMFASTVIGSLSLVVLAKLAGL